MGKQNLFDKSSSIRINRDDLKNTVSIKLPDDVAESLLKVGGVQFPYKYFEKILRQRKLKPLEESLFKKWKDCLPPELHKGCLSHSDTDIPDNNKNCYKSSREFEILYIFSGNQFVQLIEENKKILRNIIKEKLAILFYTKAFMFIGGYSYFQVGEMSKLMLKEGLKEISDQLKQLETKSALEISNENLKNVRKESLYSEDGYEDVEQFQQKFWEIEKDDYQTKLQIEESTHSSFIDYFIRGINTLQNMGEKLQCISNIRKGINHEHPFADIFKVILSSNYDSVETEPEKGCGRIDLKIKDKRLPTPIIIEFKGWWNVKKLIVIDQILGYLTDFEKEGFIFMINHTKTKDIVPDYKAFLIDPQTNYINESWKIESYKETGFIYYSTMHNIDNKIKTINHFIFNANRN